MATQIHISVPSDWDSSFDVSDECSPNSLQSYTSHSPSEGNCLVSNKGNIKDARTFREELLQIITQRQTKPKCADRKRTQSVHKAPFISIKGFKSWLVNASVKHIIMELNQSKELDTGRVDFTCKPRALHYNSFSNMPPKSASRKMSSSKILNMLQKSVY